MIDRREMLTGGAALAALPAPSVGAPSAGDRLIAGPELAEDVEILRRAFSTIHPGLFRYNSPGEISAGFDGLHASLSGGATLAQTYLTLARFTASVRCGHTFLNPYNQSQAVRAALYGRKALLPFHFRWIDRRMVVLRSFSAEAALTPGTEVEAIDGRPAAALLAALLPLSRTDGHNQAKQLRNLEVRGEGDWEAFDILYPLLFPTTGSRIRLRLRPPGQTARTVEVEAVDGAARRAAANADTVDTRGDRPLWTLLEATGGHPARLIMPTWAVYDSKWDWKAWLNGALDRMAAARTPALVVDLRGDEGGSDCGDLILSRLVKEAVRPPTSARKVRYRSTPADLRPMLDTWDASFQDWGAAAVGPELDGFYRLTKYDDDAGGDLVRPSGKRFEGKLAVLVDAANSSATFQFAQIVRQAKLGVLIGEPTGGNQRGINGGAFFFLRLPHSGLEVDLPIIGRFPDAPAPDAGLIPDVVVQPTAREIATGADPVLGAAAHWARG